jgi:hypothetical protein
MEGVDEDRSAVRARPTAQESHDQARHEAAEGRQEENGPANLENVGSGRIRIATDHGADASLYPGFEAFRGEAGQKSDGDAQKDRPPQARVAAREAREVSQAPRRPFHRLLSPLYPGPGVGGGFHLGKKLLWQDGQRTRPDKSGSA